MWWHAFSSQVLFRLEFEFRPTVVLDHVRVVLEASRCGLLSFPLYMETALFVTATNWQNKTSEKSPSQRVEPDKQSVFTLPWHRFCKYLSPSLNSDGEETNAADNSEEIYYSLNYEADLLFTRFANFTGTQKTLHVEKNQMMKFGFNLGENKWQVLFLPKGIASVSVWHQVWAGFGGAWSDRSSLQSHIPGEEMCSPFPCH